MTVRDAERHEPLPHHVTTPLLGLITERSLDEDYAHVAARKAAAPAGPGSSRPRRGSAWTTAVVLALFGGLVSFAAVQTSRDSEVDALGRAALIKQIEASRAVVTRLQGRVRSLTDSNLAAERLNRDLAERASSLATRQRRLEVPGGWVPVRGPGVRIEIASAPGADPNDEVRDEDLALLVDGLWAAGAEAIAINDQRINALGGIRNTNRAIHVNGRPLTAPYVVEAIGDRATLQARLLESAAGLEWFATVDQLGFSYEPQNVDLLRLPAATLRPLRQAQAGAAADTTGRPTEERSAR